MVQSDNLSVASAPQQRLKMDDTVTNQQLWWQKLINWHNGGQQWLSKHKTNTVYTILLLTNNCGDNKKLSSRSETVVERQWDTSYWSKIVIFHTPLHSTPR